MRAKWHIDRGSFHLHVSLSPFEELTGFGQGQQEIHLITHTCVVDLPVDPQEPHPDLLCLAAILITRPWIGSTLRLSHPVSQAFAESVSQAFEFEIASVDNSLKPREAGHTVGLSFSGGADSVAVSQLLPADSPHIHLRRISHPRIPNRATHVRADVAEDLVRQMGARGPNVLVVNSNLEFMVGPYPSYPAWPTLAIGSVLLADHLKLGTVAFGSVLGSRYLHNGMGFDPRIDPDPWGRVLEAAGLPVMQPAGGMSEIVTFEISRDSRVGDLARSCALGTLRGPCLSCTKCIRKDLIRAAVDRTTLDPVLLRNLANHPEVAEKFVQGPPYYFQHTLAYALARAVETETTFLGPVKHRLQPEVESTEWLERYYGPALTQDIPEPWRDSITKRILQFCDLMTPEDESVVQRFDPLKDLKPA